MAYMGMVIGAIAIGLIVIIAYVVISNAMVFIPQESVNDTAFNASFTQSQSVVYLGFGLIGIGVLISAGYALYQMWA